MGASLRIGMTTEISGCIICGDKRLIIQRFRPMRQFSRRRVRDQSQIQATPPTTTAPTTAERDARSRVRSFRKVDRRLAVPERQQRLAEVADPAADRDGDQEIERRARRATPAASTKILKGIGGGRSDGIATASRPYFRNSAKRAIDVALVKPLPEERFAALAREPDRARSSRPPSRASTAARRTASRSGCWMTQARSSAGRRLRETTGTTNRGTR